MDSWWQPLRLDEERRTVLLRSLRPQRTRRAPSPGLPRLRKQHLSTWKRPPCERRHRWSIVRTDHPQATSRADRLAHFSSSRAARGRDAQARRGGPHYPSRAGPRSPATRSTAWFVQVSCSSIGERVIDHPGWLPLRSVAGVVGSIRRVEKRYGRTRVSDITKR